ncbi:MAG: LytR/AlgR family response regulator transcription factor [Massilia sp.]
MTLRALIVDDEEPGRTNLRLALGDHPGWTVVGECASAAAAQATLTQQAVDVVFLDIQMPHESGLVLARTLAASSAPPLVIFVTAHNSFALEAFEVHALDYLLKPINDVRLAASLERAQLMLAQRQRAAYGAALRHYANDNGGYLQQVGVRSVGSVECIRMDDVLWIEACGNYVQLHLAERSVMHRSAVSKLHARLDPADFMQVHRGVLVRVDQAARLSIVGDGSFRLQLRCGAEVPVSERHVDALRTRMAAPARKTSFDDIL